MIEPSRAVIALLATAATLLVVAGPIGQVTDSTLLRVSREEWVTHGRDYGETRFSPLNQINVGNVDRLGLEWSFELSKTRVPVRGNPLMYGGVLYGSWADAIFAVDARTGVLRWRWDPKIPTTAYQLDEKGNQILGADGRRIRIGPSVCCVRVNRGVAIYGGKVYAGLLDGRLVALDARTGEVVWQVQSADFTKDYSITMAPRVVKGKVIVGNSGADFGVRGYVDAYDAETGRLAWRFYTVPGDPSKGFENDAMKLAATTWKGEWWKVGGGGTVWDGVSYDPVLDLLYIGVGNGGPWVQEYRSPGGGDNLFLASIVAVKPDTGRYVWHYQATPGDTWDWGANAEMTLVDLKIGGRTRKVLMQANKNGFFYVLDRETGKFISAQPFAKVTWATGVDPGTGRPVEVPGARYGTQGVVLSPRPAGAHVAAAMSYNPMTGLAYIPAVDSTAFYRKDSAFVFQPGRRNQGNGLPLTAEGAPPLVSFLAAWDPVQQKQRWRVNGVGYGTLTTAGNLVFADASNKRFGAYHAETGARLWESQPVPELDFSNPITYMLDGKQYISVMSPSHLVTFALNGAAPMPQRK